MSTTCMWGLCPRDASTVLPCTIEALYVEPSTTTVKFDMPLALCAEHSNMMCDTATSAGSVQGPNETVAPGTGLVATWRRR